MHDYQKAFIEFALERDVLRFGEFTLKSGRKSPYFFNAGLFNTGGDLAKLGQYYAEALVAANIEFDVLFGPAYKGIPIATTTAVALAEKHDVDTPYCFNRKEKKDHGEGGNIIGAKPNGNVLIIDDVLSAGTAGRESIETILNLDASPACFIVGLDRQEKGNSEKSSSSELSTEFNIKVESIVNLDTLINFVENDLAYSEFLPNLNKYREEWGA